MRMLARGFTAAVTLLASAAALPAATAQVTNTSDQPTRATLAPLHLSSQAVPGQYIVTLNNGVDPSDFAKKFGVSPMFHYTKVFSGFASTFSAAQLDTLRRTAGVAAVEENATVTATALNDTPGTDTGAPATDTGAPAANADAPAADSGAPATTTDTQATDSGAQAPDTAAPATTTDTQATDSGAQAPDTAAPATNADAPANSTDAQGTDADAAWANADAAGTDANTPATDTSAPADTTDAPATDASTQAPDTAAPATDADAPATDADTAAPDTSAPATDANTPAADTTAPAADAGSSDDRAAAASWGLDRIDQPNLPLDHQFNVTGTGAGATAYVLDTGIDYAHSEFGGRAVPGYDVIGDGRNGQDCEGHGTHVSGTIAGATYGVARQANLVSVRVLDCQGNGTLAGVIAGMDWVAQHAHQPAVANASLGGAYSPALNDAADALSDSGVLPVVAAGNDSSDACNSSPASAPRVMAIGASDASDNEASFSNSGSCVSMFAPGTSIVSAKLGGGSTTMDGTSMASPHVAGAALLYKAEHPDADAMAVADGLTASATQNVLHVESGSPDLLLYTGGL